MNFTDENRPSEIEVNDGLNFDASDDLLSFDGGGSWTDFVDDVEGGDKFDNFLSKKMRERRTARKEAEAGGLSKKDAKAVALEKVPRQSLRDVLAKLKKGEVVASVQTPDGEVKLSSDPTKAMDDISNALQNSGAGKSVDTSGGSEIEQAGFLAGNKKIILIGAVVVVAGYFLWKKFGQQGGK
jgi:hypothetical protein